MKTLEYQRQSEITGEPVYGRANLARITAWAGVAVLAFHAAYLIPGLSFCTVFTAYGLIRIAGIARQTRPAFYIAMSAGMAMYGPHLAFFWRVFGLVAVSLWGILALWLAVFVVLARWVLQAETAGDGSRKTRRLAWVLLPIMWMGFDYARGEMTYLRFTWLNFGYALGNSLLLRMAGMYGSGFIIVAAAMAMRAMQKHRWALPASAAILIALAILSNIRPTAPDAITLNAGSAKGPFIVGIQLEDPSEALILSALDKARATYPQADIFVLGEDTFLDTPPDFVTDWCLKNNTTLIVGGNQPINPAHDHPYYNTAFVIGPQGKIIFTQAKSAPVQFFDDGLPAQQQQVWESPWGKIGICICYDLSYTRVMDAFIRQGAQALIVPTMDAWSWGKYEHELHARVAPVRAAEYGVPIARVCTSGISQLVLADGSVATWAPYGENGARIAGRLPIATAGRLPADRWPATASMIVTVLAAVGILARRVSRRIADRGRRRRESTAAS